MPTNNNYSKTHKVFIETYGCQMNFADSEVVMSILNEAGYGFADELKGADVVLINTCAIRDNAEQRILGRLDCFRLQKEENPSLIVGVMGCMAERLKEKLLEHKVVDIVVGPDAYRDLPKLLAQVREKGEKQINTTLSHEETYAEISPLRLGSNGVSAFISIMRGCNNVCSYCVVPYTRGAERSRDPHTIVREACQLAANGYKEINLLGQNVDSYNWSADGETVTFANLLAMVAEISPDVRVRFSTSHPKDMKDEVLYTMAEYPNICRHIHLPVQSGSNVMLEKMNRKHTREWYLERIAKIREVMPGCAITTDVIAGFCSETDEDHQLTLDLFRRVKFDAAFMFQYSERPGTKAARQFKDDVSPEVKTARLNEIIALQNQLSLESNKADIGKTFRVLVEGPSKRSDKDLMGRNSQNKSCVFPACGHKAGEYVNVVVKSCTSATLLCELCE